jgi:hypothetical protein
MVAVRWNRWLPLLLSPLLTAQQPGKLNIVIVEGDGAINNIRQRVAREPIVQVEDENRRPVAGAAVTFFLPDQGASGTFANGARSLTVVTNEQGRAVATGFRPNNVAGKFNIRVTASHEGRTASLSIGQTNIAAAAAVGMSAAMKALIIVAVAGGAAAGVAVAAGGGNSGSPNAGPATSPRPVTTLTPGTGIVGGPQ